jgi:hypothetical protein
MDTSITRTGAAALPSAKFRVHQLKADDLVAAPPALGEPRAGISFFGLALRELKAINNLIASLRNPSRQKLRRAAKALHALYGDDISKADEVTNTELYERVKQWLAEKKASARKPYDCFAGSGPPR